MDRYFIGIKVRTHFENTQNQKADGLKSSAFFTLFR